MRTYRPKGEVNTNIPKRRSAMTLEARENQCINYATDLAEQQLRDGTASSQVIVHYLKLGTTKAKLELELLEKQAELMAAKTEALRESKKLDELYSNAIASMKLYTGADQDDNEEDIQ